MKPSTLSTRIASAGNVGLGLQIWLRQINAYEDYTLYLTDKPATVTLQVSAANWKWLLYQFVIQHQLTKKKLARLFGAETQEMNEVVAALLKAKIIDPVGPDTYAINRAVLPNIENWLVQQGILV